MSSVCSKLGIPDYLHCNGRSKDDNFNDDESLYRRFFIKAPYEEWEKNNQTSASIFPVQNDSYVRSEYVKEPIDALYNDREVDEGSHYYNAGILEVKILPIKQFKYSINGQPRKFILQPSHEPTTCIFPHSEVHVYENGNRIDSNKPRSVNLAIRVELIRNSRIIKRPA